MIHYFVFTAVPTIRVSVDHGKGTRSTLRCYVDGYYPLRGMEVHWYPDPGTKKDGNSSCATRPFDDGTFQTICDYDVANEDVYKPVCVATAWVSGTFLESSLKPNVPVTPHEIPYWIPNVVVIFIVIVGIVLLTIVVSHVYIDSVIAIIKSVTYRKAGYGAIV